MYGYLGGFSLYREKYSITDFLAITFLKSPSFDFFFFILGDDLKTFGESPKCLNVLHLSLKLNLLS